jgi:hypothetical protein
LRLLSLTSDHLRQVNGGKRSPLSALCTTQFDRDDDP